MIYRTVYIREVYPNKNFFQLTVSFLHWVGSRFMCHFADPDPSKWCGSMLQGSSTLAHTPKKSCLYSLWEVSSQLLFICPHFPHICIYSYSIFHVIFSRVFPVSALKYFFLLTFSLLKYPGKRGRERVHSKYKVRIGVPTFYEKNFSNGALNEISNWPCWHILMGRSVDFYHFGPPLDLVKHSI